MQCLLREPVTLGDTQRLGQVRGLQCRGGAASWDLWRYEGDFASAGNLHIGLC